MDIADIYFLCVGIILALLIGQSSAWGNIGNRPYSIWYETHFLVEKKGAARLIYFKPKHFGRYTLFEVGSFFFSFVHAILLGALFILLSKNMLSQRAFRIIVIATVLFVGLVLSIIVIINDIGSGKDKKKKFYLATGERETVAIPEEWITGRFDKQMAKSIMQIMQERNHPYFTKSNLYASYFIRIDKAKKDPEKADKINRAYIEYFKNMEKLVVEKENKDGSLVLKIQK